MSGKPGEARVRDLALARMPFLRPEERISLAETIDEDSALSRLSARQLENFLGRKFRPGTWEDPALGALALSGDGSFGEAFLREAERDLRFCESRGINYVRWDEESYPPLLREIAEMPFLLFFLGRLPDPERPCAAVVGTREPTARGFSGARRLGRELAEAGIPVVSGLARGIDAAAHMGALEARGYTLGVLGCGIDAVYPVSNAPLARRILGTGGCILSEYPPGTAPLKFRFPERNRILSGLCRATVIVQAPAKSGALITADFALDQGRDLFVLAEGIEGLPREAEGTEALARDGAPCVGGAADILAAWGIARPGRGEGEERERVEDIHGPLNAFETGRRIALNVERELCNGASKNRSSNFEAPRE